MGFYDTSDPSKPQKDKDFWGWVLPKYLGEQMRLIGAIVMATVGFKAILIVIGLGILADVMTLMGAAIIGATWYWFEGDELQVFLKELGEWFDNLTWEDVLEHKWILLSELFGVTLAAISIFPPAFLAPSVASLAVTLGLTGLSAGALAFLLYLLVSFVIPMLISLVTSIIEYASSPEGVGKKALEQWVKRAALQLRKMGAVTMGAIGFDGVLIVVGTGTAAFLIAALGATIFGLAWYALDGRRFYETAIIKLTNLLTLNVSIDKGQVLLHALGITAALIILFPPAMIAPTLASVVAAIGLSGLSAGALALISYVVVIFILPMLYEIVEIMLTGRQFGAPAKPPKPVSEVDLSATPSGHMHRRFSASNLGSDQVSKQTVLEFKKIYPPPLKVISIVEERQASFVSNGAEKHGASQK